MKTIVILMALIVSAFAFAQDEPPLQKKLEAPMYVVYVLWSDITMVNLFDPAVKTFKTWTEVMAFMATLEKDEFIIIGYITKLIDMTWQGKALTGKSGSMVFYNIWQPSQ